MKRFILLALIAIVSIIADDLTSTVSSEDDRILNGRRVPKGHFLYQVSIQTKAENETMMNIIHICGGVILAPEWILTAAHCFNGKTQLTNYIINAGVKDCYDYNPPSQSVAVQEAIIHAKYSNVTEHNDIALLKLASPLNFTADVQPIALPPKSYTKTINHGYIVGWGRTNDSDATSRHLLAAVLPVAKDAECEHYFLHMEKLYNQICFANNLARACPGDSGGPFVQVLEGKPRVVGITSTGEADCVKYTKVLYTRVSAYVDWIENVMNGTANVIDDSDDPGFFTRWYRRIIG